MKNNFFYSIKGIYYFLLIIIFSLYISNTEAVSEVETKTPNSSKNIAKSFGIEKNNSKSPVFIKSDTLSLDASQRVFTYRDNVEVTQDDMQITADKMVGEYDQKNQIQTITCESNVVITKGSNLYATSNRAIYHVPQGVIELTEGPELARNGNVLSADKVIIYANEDRTEAQGNVRVKVLNTGESKD